MGKPFFERGKRYPSDVVGGEFVDLPGEVISVDEQEYDDEMVKVVVMTDDHGEMDGFTLHPPKVGYRAVLRHYNWGGGWYPDDMIVEWANECTVFEEKGKEFESRPPPPPPSASIRPVLQ